MEKSEVCPDGCSYVHIGDLSSVFCFGPGERSGSLECPSTSTEGKFKTTQCLDNTTMI